MTQQYTGTPYSGQNNLSLQGCFHAMITHGQPQTKTIAATALKLWTQHTNETIPHQQFVSQSQALLNELANVPEQDRTMMAWSLNALRLL